MKDRDQIYLLYFETLTGSISTEDQLFVQKSLQNNVKFQEIWASFEQESLDLNINVFADSINENAALKDLKGQLSAKNLNRDAEAGQHSDTRFGAESSNTLKEDFATSASGHSNLTPSILDNQESLIVTSDPDLPVPSRALGIDRRKVIRLRWAAIFIVLIGLSGTWYWITRHSKVTDIQQIAAIVQQDKKEVQLQLAGGNKVTITNNQALKQIKVNGGSIALNMDSLSINAGDTAQNLLVVPRGRFYQITLGDGTKVTLNASSTLRFPFRFAGATREVFVDGEAYFSVTKDATRPFIVHTPLTSIKVLGTKFNVNSYNPTEVKASLIEGSISTKANNSMSSPILLRPGKQASFDSKAGFETHSFDTEDVLSWLNGVYYFHNMSIEQLAEVMSRNFGVAVIVDNPKIEGRSVTGVMDRKKLSELLSDLSMTAGVKSYFKNNQLYLQ